MIEMKFLSSIYSSYPSFFPHFDFYWNYALLRNIDWIIHFFCFFFPLILSSRTSLCYITVQINWIFYCYLVKTTWWIFKIKNEPRFATVSRNSIVIVHSERPIRLSNTEFLQSILIHAFIRQTHTSNTSIMYRLIQLSLRQEKLFSHTSDN